MADDTYYMTKGSIFCRLADVVRTNTDITEKMYLDDILLILGSCGFLYEELTDSDLETIYNELYVQEVTA